MEIAMKTYQYITTSIDQRGVAAGRVMQEECVIVFQAGNGSQYQWHQAPHPRQHTSANTTESTHYFGRCRGGTLNAVPTFGKSPNMLMGKNAPRCSRFAKFLL